MTLENIPVAEYERLADTFRPKPGATRESAIASMTDEVQYVVMTTRHHAGFSLWNSKVNPHNLVNSSPHGRGNAENSRHMGADQP